MDLPTYIRLNGIETTAQLFGVSKHTTTSWLYRNRRPKPEKAVAIETLTKGKVTLREIFDHRDGR